MNMDLHSKFRPLGRSREINVRAQVHEAQQCLKRIMQLISLDKQPGAIDLDEVRHLVHEAEASARFAFGLLLFRRGSP